MMPKSEMPNSEMCRITEIRKKPDNSIYLTN